MTIIRKFLNRVLRRRVYESLPEPSADCHILLHRMCALMSALDSREHTLQETIEWAVRIAYRDFLTRALPTEGSDLEKQALQSHLEELNSLVESGRANPAHTLMNGFLAERLLQLEGPPRHLHSVN